MSSTFRKFFKSSSDGKKLTKKRTSGTAEVIDSAPLPPRYSQDHAPLQPPPSFGMRHHSYLSPLSLHAPVLTETASRPPSIAPSVASHVTQLPTYESVVPPGSRGTSGLRWQSNGYFGAAEPPLPSIPRSPTPEPLSEEQIVAFAQTKERLARLPKELWDVIGNMLDPASAASLKLSCRVIHDAMSQHHFFQLNEPHNKQHKLEFLYAGTLYASVPDGSPPSPTTADDEVDEVTLADVDALPLSTAAPYASESAKEGANVDKKGKQKRSVIPAAGSAAVSVTGMGSRVTSQCAECRPLRRCEQCGTEYLMQLKVAEDRVRRKSSASGGAAPEPVLPKFRPYLSVTRYSDLGPCVRPDEPQWLSVAGSDGEVPNEVRMPVCAESPKHLKSVRGAFEGDESSGGGGVGGAAIPLGRRIEWVREHMKELDEERDRERMLADRRAKPQLMTNKS
ncbi:hypothetical protein FH972_025539 [Carpinus fangiana]|uniref:F-box domain-containing protein n=1 Tax=Carpinus fangiana TaxID=176857 RepID=A0A5N6L2B6_9ROSI|nr:hypothetical protein FH972_025539 [Carpinus fangiana]